LREQRFEYRLSRADHLALAGAGRRDWLGFAFIMGAAAVAIGFASLSDEGGPLAFVLAVAPPFGELAVLGGALLIWYVFLRILRAVLRARRATRLAEDAGPVGLTAGPGGLSFRTAGAARGLRWSEIAIVSLRDEHIMIVATDGTVYVVPQSAFTSRAAMVAFAFDAEAAMQASDGENAPAEPEAEGAP
jgi:hypothetical protein